MGMCRAQWVRLILRRADTPPPPGAADCAKPRGHTSWEETLNRQQHRISDPSREGLEQTLSRQEHCSLLPSALENRDHVSRADTTAPAWLPAGKADINLQDITELFFKRSAINFQVLQELSGGAIGKGLQSPHVPGVTADSTQRAAAPSNPWDSCFFRPSAVLGDVSGNTHVPARADLFVSLSLALSS